MSKQEGVLLYTACLSHSLVWELTRMKCVSVDVICLHMTVLGCGVPLGAPIQHRACSSTALRRSAQGLYMPTMLSSVMSPWNVLLFVLCTYHHVTTSLLYLLCCVRVCVCVCVCVCTCSDIPCPADILCRSCV